MTTATGVAAGAGNAIGAGMSLAKATGVAVGSGIAYTPDVPGSVMTMSLGQVTLIAWAPVATPVDAGTWTPHTYP